MPGPAPWSGHASPFGFSAGAEARPWLPQPSWFAEHATDRALADTRSFWHLYRDGLQLRRGLPQLGEGPLRWLEAPPDVLAFERGDGLVCAVNFGTAPVPAPRPRIAAAGQRAVPARGAARCHRRLVDHRPHHQSPVRLPVRVGPSQVPRNSPRKVRR